MKIDAELNYVVALALGLGIVLGFAAGITVSGGEGSDVVELQDPEYPYEGIEAGVGEGTGASNSTMQTDGEPYLGSGELKIVAYEDFQCPFCRRFHGGAYPQIIENYVESGEATYYFKNYPLANIHPWARKGAVASECALEQDAEAYWTFNKGFFDNQQRLNDLYKRNRSGFDASMVRWAEQTGLDKERFEQCYSNEETLDEVRSDMEDVGRIGTPTVYVEGTEISGAQPFRRFESVIESSLQG